MVLCIFSELFTANKTGFITIGRELFTPAENKLTHSSVNKIQYSTKKTSVLLYLMLKTILTLRNAYTVINNSENTV